MNTEDNTTQHLNRYMGTYLIQHSVELISRLTNTISVVAVNNKDKALSVLEVVPPQRPYLFENGRH
jgi:hypothetical protein